MEAPKHAGVPVSMHRRSYIARQSIPLEGRAAQVPRRLRAKRIGFY